MQLREHFGSYAGGLEHALALATLAHASQRDRGTQSYVVHPVRMALALPDDDPETRTIALLHDAIEGSDLTLDDLRSEGFPEHIVQGVDAMTSRTMSFNVADQERIAGYQNALAHFGYAD